MTARRESMPYISNVSAHWDADAGKVCYFACFEGSDAWTEIPAEDFDRLTRMFAQEAIDFVCETVTSTLDRVNNVMEEFAVWRQTMESMAPKPTAVAVEPDGKEN